MRLSWRDSIASMLVAIGVLVYLAWLAGFEIPGLTEPGRVSIAMLVLGVAASISAVVPGFAELLRGSKLYLVTASALGLIALGAGVCTVFGADPYVGLAVLAITMAMMWGMATMRHVGVGNRQHHLQGPVASAR